MIVESDVLLTVKTLIIFPLIIYYSGSSKLCLLLFEFLKQVTRSFSLNTGASFSYVRVSALRSTRPSG